MNQNKLNILLNRLASAAQSLSEEEVEAVVNGRAKLRIRVEGAQSSKQASGVLERSPRISPEDAATRLRSMPSREEGAEYLQANFKSRFDLMRLARWLDIPLGSRDPRSQMEDKIIDSTIGFRLRSDAIQNRSDND